MGELLNFAKNKLQNIDLAVLLALSFSLTILEGFSVTRPCITCFKYSVFPLNSERISANDCPSSLGISNSFFPDFLEAKMVHGCFEILL